MNEALIKSLITIASGALAGGLTNSVAIWMLFHPYTPPKLFGRPLRLLQGAVPKNQPRLASAIGKTVGTRLLTEEDLTRIFARPEFRQAFDDRLSAFLHELLEVERGSLREIMGPGVTSELDAVLVGVVGHGLTQFKEYVASDRFEALVHERAQSLVDAIADEPLGHVLTPSREAMVTDAIEDWLRAAVESEGFHEAVTQYVERGANKLLTPSRTVQEILPAGLVGSLERAVAGYLPLAIQRLGSILEDPGARVRFEKTIHEVLHRFLQDLKFHQRVVARLVMNEDTVNKVLDTIEAEGAERISELLREEEVQQAMAKGVNDAIGDLMARPVTDVLGNPDDDSVEDAQGTVVRWVLSLTQDPSTRTFLVTKLNEGLDRATDKTWGDVFKRVPPERLANWLVTLARSEVAGRVYDEGLARIAKGFLDRPIGRPARFLPEDAPRKIEATIGDPLWEWLQGQIPSVVQQLDVSKRVEEKVLEFPMDKLEELVRRVTDRELRTIIYLGYGLGAFVGLVLVMVNELIY